jgi:tRNA modification GTPase
MFSSPSGHLAHIWSFPRLVDAARTVETQGAAVAGALPSVLDLPNAMRPGLNDTIVALSSAPPGSGRSGIRAILRLTGPEAFASTRRLFEPGPGSSAWPSAPAPSFDANSTGEHPKLYGFRTSGVARPWQQIPDVAHSTTSTSSAPGADKENGWLRIPGALHWRGTALSACVYLMPGPQSYTRQDVVEIHMPAIGAALDEILATLNGSGVRLASPGEFTRRALLLGRLSMTQAEAVGELIRANTADEARSWAAVAGASGRNAPAGLRDEIDELLSLLELGLDFSHEDVCLMPREELGRRLGSLIRRLSTAARSDKEGNSGLAWGGAPRVVFVGPTGAGKSTLLNALAGRDVALVSATEHTTRDPVEILHELEPGLTVRLTDTAGLGQGETSPPQALQALAFTERAVKAADILLIVLDRTAASATDTKSLAHLLRTAKPAAASLVWNKSDLLAHRSPLAEESRLETELDRLLNLELTSIHRVAATSQEGIAELKGHLKEQTRGLQARLASAWSLDLAAQRAGFGTALEALRRAQDALHRGLGEDAIAVELREASHALSDAQGVLLRHDELTESILDRIFSRFCIGK